MTESLATTAGRTAQAFATFVSIDFIRLRNRPIVEVIAFVCVQELRGMNSAGRRIEALMAELRTASADLAEAASAGTSRMVLRTRLSNAIVDAEKAERAAEDLRAVASTAGHERTSLVPDPVRDLEMENAGHRWSSVGVVKFVCGSIALRK